MLPTHTTTSRAAMIVSVHAQRRFFVDGVRGMREPYSLHTLFPHSGHGAGPVGDWGKPVLS